MLRLEQGKTTQKTNEIPCSSNGKYTSLVSDTSESGKNLD